MRNKVCLRGDVVPTFHLFLVLPSLGPFDPKVGLYSE